jgi:hypothetical protein
VNVPQLSRNSAAGSSVAENGAMETETIWSDTVPEGRRRVVEARLAARRSQLTELDAASRGAEGAIARTLLDLQASAVRRMISELENELAAI